MRLSSLLKWGGATSLAIGGALAMVSLWKGKEARQLELVKDISTLSALKQLLKLVPVLVAISGRVWAEKPLQGDLSKQDAAVVQVKEEKISERRTELAWLTESEPIRKWTREVEWALEDGSGVRVPVVDGSSARGGFLKVTGDVLLPAEQSTFERLANEVSGTRPVGMRRTERALLLGTHLTAVGELVAVPEHSRAYEGALRAGGRMFVLRAPRSGAAPFILAPGTTLPELIASLQITSQQCRKYGLIFGAAGAGLLAVSAVQSLAALWRQRKLRLRVQRAERERARRRRGGVGGSDARGEQGGTGGGDGLEGDASDAEWGGDNGWLGERGPQQALCVVCTEIACDTVFPGCGHMCVCSGCAGRGRMARCPICRASGAPIRVYTP